MAVIGVDVGATKIDVGLVRNKKLHRIISEPLNSKGTQSEVISQIVGLIEKQLTKSVKAIGIGVPAIVENGVLFEAVNIKSWKKVNLKKILEKKFHVPIFVNNDANCFTLGEKYFGKGNKQSSVVGITLGTGFGGGIVTDGKLYNGNTGSAGEFGQILYLGKDVEYYCSGRYFEREYKKSGKELFELAKKGNRKALQAFSSFGAHIGKALSIVVNSVDPEIIILGGSISKSFPFFKSSMMKSLEPHVYNKSFSRLKVKQAKVKHVSVLGAASLYYDSLQ
ncbi:MAG: sugar kinase [Nanoarchaeota archaeon]|nr:sugar kinase [Nanoarchaeota archaeon]|tara:strand:- start:1775 stop:2611 length:837 start_codon:yes stop_codon:yes gene_type:complete